VKGIDINMNEQPPRLVVMTTGGASKEKGSLRSILSVKGVRLMKG
jgi:hypothetical protein